MTLDLTTNGAREDNFWIEANERLLAAGAHSVTLFVEENGPTLLARPAATRRTRVRFDGL